MRITRALLGVSCMILASGVMAAPQATAQPAGCPEADQTTAYVDTGLTSHPDGVWVACVPYTDVTRLCFSDADHAKPKLYRRGEGPAPECRTIYNSH